ncbi:MAG: molybdopterin molybdotransferase MoeA [Pirellulaceae bacterium]|nr:molybdopterin molybdotransferase MoeA [Pirellulaceae bacterium]
MEQLPQVDAVANAVGTLAERLRVVAAESCHACEASGRVLSTPLCADRDSPAIDVSAMDGYAIRLSDLKAAELQAAELPVAAVAAAGSEPQSLGPGAAVQIFTGAAVPPESDCIIRREDTVESPGRVKIAVSVESLSKGLNIRRRGENTKAGDVVLPLGAVLNAPAMGAVATFAHTQLSVYRRVRVVVLNTGDELAGIGEEVQPWQIRDSNGPLLESWLRQYPWIEFICRKHVGDRLALVQSAIEQHLADADAILLTGGVSMGDTDYVPEAIANLGGEVAFHRLPIRPGRPVLGASLGGKLLLGLPGNPVSVAVTSRVIGFPLLRKLAGIVPTEEPLGRCELTDADNKTLSLVWYRLVKIDQDAKVRLVGSQGSGDLVSLSLSDGFVELPMGASGNGPWRVRWW